MRLSKAVMPVARSESGWMLHLKRLPRLAQYALMVLLVATMITPFLWMLSTSLKPEAFVLEARPNLLPTVVTLDAYRALAERVDLPRAFFNSIFVAGLGTTGQVLVSAMAAYAFSRMRWRGRNVVFMLYLGTMMIPGVVLVIPQFVLVRQLGWLNSYSALILPSLFSAFGTFLIRQSFLALPKDFEEAAFVDGANHLTIFWRIVLPLSGPALATLAIFCFMGLWNSYLWPLFVARKEAVMTLPVALAFLQAETRGVTEWNIVMAGSVVAVLPILITYMFAQRWFVRGVVVSGIKG